MYRNYARSFQKSSDLKAFLDELNHLLYSSIDNLYNWNENPDLIISRYDIYNIFKSQSDPKFTTIFETLDIDTFPGLLTNKLFNTNSKNIQLNKNIMYILSKNQLSNNTKKPFSISEYRDFVDFNNDIFYTIAQECEKFLETEPNILSVQYELYNVIKRTLSMIKFQNSTAYELTELIINNENESHITKMNTGYNEPGQAKDYNQLISLKEEFIINRDLINNLKTNKKFTFKI